MVLSDCGSALSDHPVVPSEAGTAPMAISTSTAESGTTLVPKKKKGKKTCLLSTVPLPLFMYDDDVEVISLTENVKKYRESHPIPSGCLVSTIYGTIIDIKRPAKPHPDLTPFEKRRHDLFSPRLGLSSSQRRLPLPPPSSSSSGSGSSGDGSGSEGQSSGGGLQYETDSDEDDDDDDEEEEKEEKEEDEEGQGQGDVIELSSDAGQHADQMEVDEGQAQAQFSAGGQAQGPDPSDDESVFSADLLRWADEHTESQAAAQLAD
ncbi:hypothetical protein AcV5_003366 [Taiwanofungus camphoratus]|nr:hypothetical protein AcV5_003366 [Antrodia cinnamomea]